MGNWIAGAIKHPGAFTKKAKSAGKSVAEYAQEEKGAGGTTGRQARLAITLAGFHHKRKNPLLRGLHGD